MMKEHEKFWAFAMLGFGVMLLAVLAVVFPPEAEGTQRTIDAAMGALSLALGVAANALFRIREPGEEKVKIDNLPTEPVPTAPQPAPVPAPVGEGELPEEQKL